jgi:hypothetical protein
MALPEKIEDIVGTGSGLLKYLQEALEQYEAAHERARAASLEENAAINKLNEAQKSFDAFHKALHEQKAPWNTEWHSQRNRGEPVT